MNQAPAILIGCWNLNVLLSWNGNDALLFWWHAYNLGVGIRIYTSMSLLFCYVLLVYYFLQFRCICTWERLISSFLRCDALCLLIKHLGTVLVALKLSCTFWLVKALACVPNAYKSCLAQYQHRSGQLRYIENGIYPLWMSLLCTN